MSKSFRKALSIVLTVVLIASTFAAMCFSATADDLSQSGQYRNLAFRRAAWHSTATNYNQTGHLVTDGIVNDDINYHAYPKFTASNENTAASETADKAFDKNTKTKWLAFMDDASTPAWLQIRLPDYKMEKSAASYSITSANDAPNRDPKKWILQGSMDGVNFVDLDSRENQSWDERYQERTFDIADNTTVYRYYRLYILSNSGDSGDTNAISKGPRLQLSEFDIFDADGNSLFVFDDDTYTNFDSYWASKSDGEQYVYIDLGADSSVNKVVVDWGDYYANTYDIQRSFDAESWSTIKSVTNGDGGIDTIEFDTVTAHYVRVLCKETDASCYTINEVEVWGVNDFSYSVGELPEPLEDGTQYLRGGNWKISRASEVTADGVALSSGNYDDSSWLPATVPGTALMSYLNAGAIPDPNYDDWQFQISDSYFTTNYWYTNSFVVPASQQGKTTWLNFDSINWKADVYLNGEYLQQIKGAFIRTKIDITDVVKYGEENYLAVYIHMNDNPGNVTIQTLATPNKNGGILGADNPTIHASIGWDWVPTIRGRNVGIYDEVYLSYTDDVQIRYPWAYTDLDLGGITLPDVQLENLAIGATATASSIETVYNNGTNVPSRANDGDMSTRWSSAYYDNQWFMLDFGKPTTFNSVVINWETGYATDYVLQYSNDDKTFTDILTEPNCTGGKDVKVFDPITARYLRISTGKRVTQFGNSFWEFEVYNTEPENIIPTYHGPDFSKSDVTVAADISNTYDEAVTATVNGVINPGNITFTKDITVPAGSVSEIVFDDIVIENPEIWWPNTYGDQPLYDCELTVSLNGEVSDKQSFKFGVRKFTYSEGSPLEIYCNGTRIVCRGGNWGMDDSNLACTDEDYDTKVRLHAEANLTMIRNWVGMTGNEAFYEACDKYGVLIFDDFWLANPLDGPNPDDEDMFFTTAVDKIKRVRKYASLVLYCGRNEGNPPTTINNALIKYTSELDGTRHYIPHSAAGTVSGQGPYYTKDTKWYFDNARLTLHSERGMPNIPSVESIKMFLSEENQWPMNDVWGLHDYCRGGAMNLNTFQNETKHFGTYDDLESFVRVAQMVNYESHKALFESMYNIRSNGMLMWMSQSAWPSFIWQTYDYFYDTNAGYFAAKAANQPVNAFWNCSNDNIILTNNTPQTYEDVKVVVNEYDLNGKLIWSDTKTLDIVSDSNELVTKMVYPENTTNVKFIKTFTYNSDNEKIAEDFYWTNSATYQDYTALDTLDYVDLDATYSAKKKEGTTNFYTVDVENNTNKPALMIRVKTSNDLTGERVLPAYYEDNYFSLMPGESKSITVEFDESKLNGGNPVFEIEGWNVNDGVIETTDEVIDNAISVAANGMSFDISLTGETNVGTVYVALYDTDGTMNAVTSYPAAEAKNVTFDPKQTGDYVKIMWWNDMQPMCDCKEIPLE